ncbi:hypothetical protein NX059_003378 [Plenodomus lindquistii]|nr:hypothetical protein NX059_003378 [Plenodomus lindquistii]
MFQKMLKEWQLPTVRTYSTKHELEASMSKCFDKKSKYKHSRFAWIRIGHDNPHKSGKKLAHRLARHYLETGLIVLTLDGKPPQQQHHRSLRQQDEGASGVEDDASEYPASTMMAGERQLSKIMVRRRSGKLHLLAAGSSDMHLTNFASMTVTTKSLSIRPTLTRATLTPHLITARQDVGPARHRQTKKSSLRCRHSYQLITTPNNARRQEPMLPTTIPTVRPKHDQRKQQRNPQFGGAAELSCGRSAHTDDSSAGNDLVDLRR